MFSQTDCNLVYLPHSIIFSPIPSILFYSKGEFMFCPPQPLQDFIRAWWEKIQEERWEEVSEKIEEIEKIEREWEEMGEMISYAGLLFFVDLEFPASFKHCLLYLCYIRRLSLLKAIIYSSMMTLLLVWLLWSSILWTCLLFVLVHACDYHLVRYHFVTVAIVCWHPPNSECKCSNTLWTMC